MKLLSMIAGLLLATTAQAQITDQFCRSYWGNIAYHLNVEFWSTNEQRLVQCQMHWYINHTRMGGHNSSENFFRVSWAACDLAFPPNNQAEFEALQPDIWHIDGYLFPAPDDECILTGWISVPAINATYDLFGVVAPDGLTMQGIFVDRFRDDWIAHWDATRHTRLQIWDDPEGDRIDE